MRPDDSASTANEQQIGFRIADLTNGCPCVGPTVFRFVNRRTIATTDLQHSAFVEAARSFLSGEELAFNGREIRFAGVPPNVRQLTEFARTLTKDTGVPTTRPIIGRYWTVIEIPEVGTFDGVSFWLSFRDLTKVSWAPAAAIDILGLRNPVYIESIDQCLPEILSVKPADVSPRSAIEPSLKTTEILDLLIRAIAPAPELSRREWEIVSECRSFAYALAKVAADAKGLPIEAPWRWNPEFTMTIARQRASWIGTQG